VDLGELRILMVAKEGSFSPGCRTPVSHRQPSALGIRKLEDSLGQPLFVRGSRPYA